MATKYMVKYSQKNLYLFGGYESEIVLHPVNPCLEIYA